MHYQQIDSHASQGGFACIALASQYVVVSRTNEQSRHIQQYHSQLASQQQAVRSQRAARRAHQLLTSHLLPIVITHNQLATHFHHYDVIPPYHQPAMYAMSYIYPCMLCTQLWISYSFIYIQLQPRVRYAQQQPAKARKNHQTYIHQEVDKLVRGVSERCYCYYAICMMHTWQHAMLWLIVNMRGDKQRKQLRTVGRALVGTVGLARRPAS